MKNKLYGFLKDIDNDFPIPLSQKTDLNKLAEKFAENGLIFSHEQGEKIVSAVLGYANDTENKTAFISVVGTLKEYRGKGIAEKLVREFIIKSISLGMERVILYTHHTNEGAIRLYQKIGFVQTDSDRPGDFCFVYEEN